MAQSFNTSLKNVAVSYLGLLDVKVTSSSIKRDIEENPYYPSLLSLSETFGRYHINNSAFEVAPEKLDQVEAPFVAFVSMPGIGLDFVVVVNLTDEAVTYLYNSKSRKTISKKTFLSQYRNVVWVAEPDENSGEPGFEKNRSQEHIDKYKKSAWAGCAVALLLLAIVINLNAAASVVAYLSIVLIKLTGMAASVLLLVYETDKNNTFVRNICSAGKQTNCDAVLNSKASKIWGISWGEVGFCYFAATTLWLLFPAISFSDKISWLAIANAFAAPYILFSIYYQWKVLKQWCPLCLTVQAVLLLELIWNIANFWAAGFSIRLLMDGVLLRNMLSMALCVLLPIVAWYGMKPIFRKSKDANLYSAAYKRLQYNPDIFNSLLAQQAKAPDGWQQLGISIGNPDAGNIIIKVCNPYCNPCAMMHSVLEEIINYNKNVQLKIIFTTDNSEKDKGAIVVKHLMSIAAEGNALKIKLALDDWYLAEKKDYDAFAGKYVMNGELQSQGAKLDAMSNWCKEAEIPHTPTIFVNGYRLPEYYEVKELKDIL